MRVSVCVCVCVLAVFLGWGLEHDAAAQTTWIGGRPSLSNYNISLKDVSIPLSFSPNPPDPLGGKNLGVVSTGEQSPYTGVGGAAFEKQASLVWMTSGIPQAGGGFRFKSFIVPSMICSVPAPTSNLTSPAPPVTIPFILGMAHDSLYVASVGGNPRSSAGRFLCLFRDPAPNGGWSIIFYYVAPQSGGGATPNSWGSVHRLRDYQGNPLGVTLTDIAFSSTTGAGVPSGLLYAIDSAGIVYEFIVNTGAGTWNNTANIAIDWKFQVTGDYWEGITLDTSRPMTMPAPQGPLPTSNWALGRNPVISGTILGLDTQGNSSNTMVQILNGPRLPSPERWPVGPSPGGGNTGLSIGMAMSAEYVRFGNSGGACTCDTGSAHTIDIDGPATTTQTPAQPVLLATSCTNPLLTSVQVRVCTSCIQGVSLHLVRGMQLANGLIGIPIGNAGVPLYVSLTGAVIVQFAANPQIVSFCSMWSFPLLPDQRVTEYQQWVMDCSGGPFSTSGTLKVSDAYRFCWCMP